MRGPAHFSTESSRDAPGLPRPLYASPHLGASEREPCHHPLQHPWAKPFRYLCCVKAQPVPGHAFLNEGDLA